MRIISRMYAVCVRESTHTHTLRPRRIYVNVHAIHAPHSNKNHERKKIIYGKIK